MREYIATTRSGWGRAYDEYDAVTNCLSHSRSADTEIWVFQVTGFSDVWPGGCDAEEVHSAEKFVVDRDKVGEVKSLSTDLEIAVESLLVESESERL